MTATEIIYAIREKLNAYTDDSKYKDEYLMFLINLKRAAYIRREYNQLQRTFDTDILQSICMELEEVDSSVCLECQEIGCDNCQVIRTVKKVPNTIELHSRSSIIKVSPMGVFDKPFSLVNMFKMPYAGDGKYEDKYVFASVHPNGHIYLKSKQNFYRSLGYINVIALFENPDDVAEFKCNGADCYSNIESNYPIEGWMVDFIITEIVNELANLKQLPTDVTNDAKDGLE